MLNKRIIILLQQLSEAVEYKIPVLHKASLLAASSSNTPKMSVSKLVFNILDLLLDGDEQGLQLRRQIPYLDQEAAVEYTGVGVFYGFSYKSGIDDFRSKNGDFVLDGLEITSSQLSNSAEAIIHGRNGLISSLEILSHGGDYPNFELSVFKLRQIWNGSPGRQIKVF